MLYDRIDHIVLPVRSLETAAEPFARLGLALYPGVRHEGRGTENRGFFVGGPLGAILGPFVGAVALEAIFGQTIRQALKSGLGTAVGFVASLVVDATACIVIIALFIVLVVT